MKEELVLYVGLDIHKKFSVAAVIDGDGKRLGSQRLDHKDVEGMLKYFRCFPPGTEVGIEATFNWSWIAELVESAGLVPKLGHPPRVRAAAVGMAKSDRRDTYWLARLLASPTLFPNSWMAPKEVQEMRDLFRLRQQLIAGRTAMKNSIHGHLMKRGIDSSEWASDLFSKLGREKLASQEFKEHDRMIIGMRLAMIDATNERIAEIDAKIGETLEEDPRAEILMSIPGIGKQTAYAILAEVGEISRFPCSRALASYAGVLPKNKESGGHDYGKTTGGACNQHLRHMLIECASGAICGSSAMASLHARVRSRNRGAGGKGRVAVARAVIELVWTLLTKGEKYREPRA